MSGMRVVVFLGLVYTAAVFASREWRATVRLTLTRMPWWQIARGLFDAFPSSRWSGIARIVGVPIAAYVAAVIVTLFALVILRDRDRLLPESRLLHHRPYSSCVVHETTESDAAACRGARNAATGSAFIGGRG